MAQMDLTEKYKMKEDSVVIPKISVRNLTVVYMGNHDKPAVQDFSFDVPAGGFTCLLGTSGCGKSTTLRMIAGLETITSGKIVIGDRIVNGIAPKDRDIAMVFQNYALYPHMDVFTNMAFGLKFRKTERTEINRRVQEAAEILEI